MRRVTTPPESAGAWFSDVLRGLAMVHGLRRALRAYARRVAVGPTTTRRRSRGTTRQPTECWLTVEQQEVLLGERSTVTALTFGALDSARRGRRQLQVSLECSTRRAARHTLDGHRRGRPSRCLHAPRRTSDRGVEPWPTAPTPPQPAAVFRRHSAESPLKLGVCITA